MKHLNILTNGLSSAKPKSRNFLREEGEYSQRPNTAATQKITFLLIPLASNKGKENAAKNIPKDPNPEVTIKRKVSDRSWKHLQYQRKTRQPTLPDDPQHFGLL